MNWKQYRGVHRPGIILGCSLVVLSVYNASRVRHRHKFVVDWCNTLKSNMILEQTPFLDKRDELV